jgi:chlorobactene glucosyltransferase
MWTDYAVWAGVVFVGAILIELVRLDVLFVTALKKEARISEASEPGSGEHLDHPPMVSVIMPAKDEETHIEQSARSVLASDYPHMELILINDRCQDRTSEIMERLAQEDPRVKVVSIGNLPPGWTGKTHAMFQASQLASGEIFLFTDADAVMRPSTLSRTVNYFAVNGLDMLSLLPGFTRRGFIEDAVHTHMALGIAFYYPLTEVNDRAKPAGLASGCFIMMKKQTYEEIGTWERFRRELTEDVALSKAVKATGGKLMVLRGGNLICTRPFEKLSEVCMFWKRTFYGGLDKSVPKLLRLTTNYLVLTLLSGLFVGSGIVWLQGEASLPVKLLLVCTTLAMTATVVPLVVFIRQERGHWPYGLTVPVGTLIGAWVAFTTAVTIVANDGIRWRGSVYK